jgi:hypothetical protein
MPKAIISSPLPFPTWEAVAEIKIYQTQNTEDSGTIETLIYEGKGIYDEKSSQRFDKKSHLIQVTGKLIIQGDVKIENQLQFEGYAMVNGQKTGIYTCSKNRMLGVVYSTEFELK